MKNYIPPNISNWRGVDNNDPRNFNDIGHAAIVMYTVFYRNAWNGSISPLIDVGGKAVYVGFILVMLATSYYLLNITVSITCAHYSESVEKEKADAAKRAAENELPKFDDGEDDAVENVEEEEQDLSGFQVPARERYSKFYYSLVSLTNLLQGCYKTSSRKIIQLVEEDATVFKSLNIVLGQPLQQSILFSKLARTECCFTSTSSLRHHVLS